MRAKCECHTSIGRGEVVGVVCNGVLLTVILVLGENLRC